MSGPPARPGRAWLRAAAIFLGGSLATTAAVFAARALVDPERDRALLIAINGAARGPWLDGAAVFVTDFSIALFSVLLVARSLAVLASEWRPGWQPHAAVALAAAGPLVALGVVAALREKYAPALLGGLALATCSGFALLGRGLRDADAQGRARALTLLLVTAASIALAQLAIPAVSGGLEHRPRPLSWENASWNEVLVEVPEERVRNGPSYPSGHAAGFFALVTPLLLGVGLAKRRLGARATLLAWAILHSGSRVYLAAHYPSDALAGSVLGLGIGVSAAIGLRPVLAWPPWRRT